MAIRSNRVSGSAPPSYASASRGAPGRAPPVSAGLTDAGIERVHEVAARHVGSAHVPGLVALVARGDAVLVEVLGNLTIAGPPVLPDSIFRIASMTPATC